MGKKTIEIQTTRHIFLGDLLGDDPEDVWDAVSDSDISFGNNLDTMMSKETLEYIMTNGDVPEDYQKEILDQIPEGVAISLGN